MFLIRDVLNDIEQTPCGMRDVILEEMNKKQLQIETVKDTSQDNLEYRRCPMDTSPTERIQTER